MLDYFAVDRSVRQRLRSLALASVVAAACAAVGAIVARAQALPVAYWVFDDVSTTTAGSGVRVNGYGIDPSDRPVISWTDAGAPHPFWSRKDAGVWATTVFNPNKLYPGSGDSAVGHEMALAPDGTPWMVFDGVIGEEFYMWRTDLNADPTGATLSTVIGDLTSYRNCTYGEHALTFWPAGELSDLRFHNTCNPFHSRLILNGATIASELGSVLGSDYTVAPNGSSHILYSDSGAVRHSDGTGRGTDLFGIHRFSGEVQIEADAGGTLHAVIRGYGSTWDGDPGQLVYLTSTNGGTTWSAPEIVDASRGARFPVLALDRNGLPAVAFWSWGNGLYYGSRASGAWQFSRVFSPPRWDDAEKSSRLRLSFDSANTPSIAFADWTARRVRIARPMAEGGGGAGDVPVDLRVSIAASQDVAPIGTTLTYTVSVGNQGARDATGIVLDVTLPANFAFVSATPAAASASGGQLRFNLGGLHSGVGTSVSINARASAEGKLPLHGSAAAVEPEANAADNAAQLVVDVRGDQCFAPRSGMKAWWPAEGNGTDVINGFSLGLFGGAGYAPGKIGRAFSFGGTGYARTTFWWHEDTTFVPGPNSFSMQAWIRTNRTTGFQVVAGWAQAAGDPWNYGPAAYWLSVSDGRLSAYIRDVNNMETGLTGPSVADGQFHHVALVRDMAVPELRLYLDGALAASQSLVGGAQGSIQRNRVNDSQFSVGFLYTFYGTAPNYFFAGEIDDLAWYTRALGGDEIATVYANVNSVACGAPRPPTVTVPADMTVEATGSAGATVTFEASAVDFAGALLSPVCTPASGSAFAIATTAVSCSATDESGRTGTASFTVTVSDTTPPALTLPEDMSVTATDASGAPVSFAVTATDFVDDAVSATCVPASDTTFPIGTTTVSCSATDHSGNRSTESFTITVDVPPPAIINIAEMIHVTDGPALLPSVMLSIAEAVHVTDAATLLPSVMLSIAETVHVTDAATLDITLPVPPTVTVPADMTVEATGAAGATVTFAASAADFAGAALSPVCVPASGSVFAIGTTLVSCTAADAGGRTATASFNVTVRDTTPPVLTLPADMTVGSGSAGAVITFTASATDLVAGAVTVSCTPASGAVFPLGTTTVSCASVDPAGNTASGSFQVVVVQVNRPPVIIDLPADRTVREGNAVGVRFRASDPDADALTISVTGLPPGFASPLETQGTLLEAYATLPPGSVGTYTATVTVSDGQLSVSRSFTWIVQPANHAPIARADSIVVPPGQTTAILVLANDEDADGDPLTITTVSQPTFGNAGVTYGGTIGYTPGPMVGSYEDSFTYTISDGQGGTASATVTVRVLSSTPAATLKIDVSPAAIQWVNGEPIVYTLTVTNVSTVSLTNAALTNMLPMGLGFVSATPSPSTTSGSQVTFNLGTIASGASASAVIRASRPPAPGTYTDSATVTFAGGPPASAAAALSVEPDMCFTTTSSDALVARWRGDGNALEDVSHVSAQPFGAVGYASGMIQQAFSLTGPGARLEFPGGDPRLALARFTIGAWVKPASLPSASLVPVVSRGDQSPMYWLGFNGGRPALFTLHSGNVTGSVVASAAVAPNGWYYLAGSYDGTTARLYLNGALVGQSAIGIPLVSDAQGTPIEIGYGQVAGSSNAGFSGLLDDVTLYSRALTDAEINALGNGTPATCFAATTDDLTVSVSASPVVAQTNGVITYTATVTNRTHGYVDHVTLTHDLPADLTLIDSTPAASSLSGVTQSFDLGTLLEGVSKTITIRAAAPSFDGRFTDLAKVTSSLPDTNHANDSASVTVTVEPDSCFVSPAGLVSRWRGDGNANDDVGGNNGQLSGGASYVIGRVGQGFGFQAPPHNGGIAIADSPGLRPSLFTIGAWVRPGAMSVPGWNAVMARGNGGSDPLMDAQSLTYSLGFHDGFPVLVTHHESAGRQVTQSTSAAVAGQWYHLSGSFDGTTARLYVNGVLAAQTMVGAPLYYDSTAVPTSIGWANLKMGGGIDYARFLGIVDEVLLYDRALTDAETLALFDGSPATCHVNERPVLTNPGPQVSRIGEVVALDLQAVDPDPTGPLTFAAAGLPAGLAIDSASGRISGAAAASAVGVHTVTVTVSDGKLSSEQSFAWTVQARVTIHVQRGGRVVTDRGDTCDAAAGDATCAWDYVPTGNLRLDAATLPPLPPLHSWWDIGVAGQGVDAPFNVVALNRAWTVDVSFLKSFWVSAVGARDPIDQLLVASIPITTAWNVDVRDYLTCSPLVTTGPQCEGRARLYSTVSLSGASTDRTVFDGWSGACSGTTCTLTLTPDVTTVTATYHGRTAPLTVDVGAGGSVRISDGSTSAETVCDGDVNGVTCTADILVGRTVTVTPFAPTGEAAHWTWTSPFPAPAGDDHTLSVTMDNSPQQVAVRFRRFLTLDLVGWGGHTMFDPVPVTTEPVLSPLAWSCQYGATAATCSRLLPFGSTWTLTAASPAPLSFGGWSGDCSGMGACVIALTSDSPHATAIFSLKPTAVLDVPAQVAYGQPFTLSAAQSSDADGHVVRYIWTSLDGDVLTLFQNQDVVTDVPAWTVAASATSPVAPGRYRFRLIVVDDSGVQSAPATAQVTIVNTPVGSNVQVQPAGAAGSGVSLTFGNVTTAGQTTAAVLASGPALPAGFALGTPPVMLDISTTALYAGSIAVCLDYGSTAFASPGTVRLLHFEGGLWADVTTSLSVPTHTICGSVTSLSPFVVVQPLNQPPLADAGPDQTLEATSPAGATAILNGSGSSDPDGDVLTYVWTGPFGTLPGGAISTTLPLGANTITLRIADGNDGTATDTVVVIVRDTIAPTVTIANPAGVTYAFNQTVVASYACADSGSGIASCTGPVPSGSPLDTSSEGAHTFAVTGEDVAGNTATTTVTYTVTGVEGRMEGGGEIRTPDGREHAFEFRIAERRVGLERGELHYSVKTPKAGKQKERADRFESQSIGSIVFWDDPAFRAGRGPKPTADSAIFAGTGKWNGEAGYTFEARAADEGEPGRGRDTFAITIRDGRGTVVATVGATLTGGNIQSSRLPDRHEAGETRR